MSDLKNSRKPRSVINPIRSINLLRGANGLPKISNKPKKIKVTPEQKLEITKQEIERLFPEALSSQDYQFTEDQGRKLVKAVEERISIIKAGKGDLPSVAVSLPKAKKAASEKPKAKPAAKKTDKKAAKPRGKLIS